MPVTLQFGIRYLLRAGVLAKLSEAITPIILIAWEDEEIHKEFEAFGAEVYGLPETNYGEKYKKIRRQIDFWHIEKINSPSTRIDERRNTIDFPVWAKWFRAFRRGAYSLSLKLPGAVDQLLAKEKELCWKDTNIEIFERLLDEISPDAIFSLTPFHRQEELLLRAAEARHIPMCTAIHSFDNLTTRGWIPVRFERYFLWNQYNQSELLRIYTETKPEDSIIIGSPQFDFYFDSCYQWDEKTWRSHLKLPPDRPVILFGGGPKAIVPHEPHFLAQIDQAIERGEIPDNPIVLFRRHPVDSIDRWQPVLIQAKHIVKDSPWQDSDSPYYFNVRREDIERLVSTLYYSKVHISTSSTMSVDGAIFDRPQINPAYDDRPTRKYDRVIKELYLREHYLPITNSGGIEIVYSRDEMIEAIRKGLMNPTQKSAERKNLVREICTFADGKSAERAAHEINKFVETFVVRQS